MTTPLKDTFLSTPPLPLILGSSSIFRRKVLDIHKIPHSTLNPNINEGKKLWDIHNSISKSSLIIELDPSATALAVANAKMDALLSRWDNTQPDTLLVTCDQVVSWNDEVREKPRSEEMCRMYMTSYTEIPAETHSAMVVAKTRDRNRAAGVDVARQWFHPIPPNVVDQLIKKGDVMYCAGGFMIEDDLMQPYLAKRDGTEDSIMGMPVLLLEELVTKVMQ
ncbi:hypothetical protein SmJEL517_g02452 [Synchytrium microbalum]|uniref:Maf-like protein n=1 Tax=Synchytrium microbalum TaxID=1806994 RepID=A0A507C0Q3_9FUNG|nr:uncharacterized protein SmJEL517_g02452 [Synchytrium microbalum]TPX35110.1 hypothetical protein SmJEL517_g02452 [Synchytrium microbalum]